MKFLLLYPLSSKLEIATCKDLEAGAYLPPLGLLYLGKMLEINGHTVKIIDCNVEGINKNDIKKTIPSYDAVGMTIYSKPRDLNNSINLSTMIKEYDPSIPIIIGGPHCSLLPKLALKDHQADICVIGEGELVITQLADTIEGKRELKTIPGICYKKNNRIKQTKPPEHFIDLNSLPIPARHLVDKYEYGFLLGVKIVRGRATSIITSRGCAYRCSFCQIHKITPNYRSRSVLNITNEIVETVNSGYDTLFFVDDNFLAQKKKVEKVMDFIIQNEIDVDMWILGSRVDSADKNLYEKMRNAGVKFIGFGLESGNQHVLDYYNKNITLNQIREAVALSHEMGFITHGSFILGAPFETQKHFQQTINFAKSIPLNSAAFYTLGYPYGSSLWEKAVKDGKIRSDEHSVIANSDKDLGNFSTEELINYTLKANKSFFLTPKVWARLFFHMLSVKNFRFIKLALKMINPMGESKFNK